jgi:hypothetical protein
MILHVQFAILGDSSGKDNSNALYKVWDGKHGRQRSPAPNALADYRVVARNAGLKILKTQDFAEIATPHSPVVLHLPLSLQLRLDP